MKRVQLVGLSLLFAVLIAGDAAALVFVDDRGNWPQDWPEELETLRTTSRTIGVATGLQQNIYEIPIPDRATFEKVWPAIRKIRTPGSPLTLYRAGTPPPKRWGNLLSNEKAAVRVYGPSAGEVILDKRDHQNRPPVEELIRDGRAARIGPPWPDYLRGEKGELPEWAVLHREEGSRATWIPTDPFDKKPGDPRGFYHRVRIEVELVVDGEVVDLNHVEFPEGIAVVDRRFNRR